MGHILDNLNMFAISQARNLTDLLLESVQVGVLGAVNTPVELELHLLFVGPCFDISLAQKQQECLIIHELGPTQYLYDQHLIIFDTVLFEGPGLILLGVVSVDPAKVHIVSLFPDSKTLRCNIIVCKIWNRQDHFL